MKLFPDFFLAMAPSNKMSLVFIRLRIKFCFSTTDPFKPQGNTIRYVFGNSMKMAR